MGENAGEFNDRRAAGGSAAAGALATILNRENLNITENVKQIVRIYHWMFEVTLNSFKEGIYRGSTIHLLSVQEVAFIKQVTI